MSKARVTSFDSLRAFRADLGRLGEDLRRGIEEADHEVRRVARWLQHEQPQVWAARIRKLERKHLDAVEAFRRKQNALTPTGEQQSTVLERRDVQKWKKLLEEARGKLEQTRAWARRFDREARLYRGGTAATREAPRGRIPDMIAILGRYLDHLEAYRAVAVTPAFGWPDADSKSDAVRRADADDADASRVTPATPADPDIQADGEPTTPPAEVTEPPRPPGDPPCP